MSGDIKACELEIIKQDLKREFEEHKINHSVIEFEATRCEDSNCDITCKPDIEHHHHH